MSKIQKILSEVINLPSKNPYDYQPSDVTTIKLLKFNKISKRWYGVQNFKGDVYSVTLFNGKEQLPQNALTWGFYDRFKDLSNAIKNGFVDGNGNLGSWSFLWDASKLDKLKKIAKEKGVSAKYEITVEPESVRENMIKPKSKAEYVLEKLVSENQVKLISPQFIKLIKTGKLLGNMTNLNTYTDDSRFDDLMNNKPTGFYPVAMADGEYSEYLIVGHGKVYNQPRIANDAYRNDADIKAIEKESDSKFKKGTMYFTKEDLTGYFAKRNYYKVNKDNPTIIDAQIRGSYYLFKTTDNKNLFDEYK